MLNSVQLCGLVLLGGLPAGELSRRVLSLPRTTGYVVFGLLIAQIGLNWITPLHVDSAQLFIASDVGAKGERTGLLYTMVAINGAVAFTAVALMAPFLTDTPTFDDATCLADALDSISAWLLPGGVDAGLVLLATGRLGRQVEHQHLLIRLTGQFLAARLAARRLGLSQRESLLLRIGPQPMSNVALVLLVNTQILYSGMPPMLVGILMATILLMQWFRPLATQTAIKGFAEATRLMPRRLATPATPVP